MLVHVVPVGEDLVDEVLPVVVDFGQGVLKYQRSDGLSSQNGNFAISRLKVFIS